MLHPYINRLILIRESLNSPQQETILEGYSSLFKLWLTYFSDTSFIEEIKIIAAEHMNLSREFIKRVDKLPLSKEEKESLLKSIKLLLPMVPVKIFISYSHNDESFKDELVKMLTGLERRGVIDAWQDRRIEPGSDWFNAIEKAMDECEIAVLLVSPDFIASRFIQEVELNHFFQRRIKKGLRVVPIIIRPCLWQEEPVIKNIQVLPKNGKPVISFSQTNGDRDQVWADIGKRIKEIAENQ